MTHIALALARGIQANDPVALEMALALDAQAQTDPVARCFLSLVIQMGEEERKASQSVVLQAQSAKERYLHWLFGHQNGVGRPIGPRQHHDFLQPFTGSHGPLSGEHEAAAEHIRRTQGHAADLIDTHTAWHTLAFQGHLESHPDHGKEQVLEAFFGKVEVKNGKNVRGPSFLAASRSDERKRIKGLEEQRGITLDPLLSIKNKDATSDHRYPHLPDGEGMLSVPGSVSHYHPQMQMMMHDQMAYFGLDTTDMERMLSGWVDSALAPRSENEDPYGHVSLAKNWYRHVFGWVSHQADRFGVTHDKILGATARLSPLRFWGSSTDPLKGDLAPSTNRGAIIALNKLIQDHPDIWVSPHELDQYRSKNEKAIASGKLRAFPPEGIALNPNGPTKITFERLNAHEIASFTRLAHDDQGNIIPLLDHHGARVLDNDDQPDFVKGLGVVSVTGVQPVGVALSILMGQDPVDDMVNGPKIRTFADNIMNPEDPFLAVMDTWQYRALLIHPDPNVASLLINAVNPLTGVTESRTMADWESLKRWNAKKKKGKGDWEWNIVTPQGFFQSHPKLAPYESSTGVYPVFADVVRTVATRYNMSPSELQALTWLEIQRNTGSRDGVMHALYPREKVVDSPLDAL